MKGTIELLSTISRWVRLQIENDEVGKIDFDNSESYRTLRWTKEELKEQGNFYDECFGL